MGWQLGHLLRDDTSGNLNVGQVSRNLDGTFNNTTTQLLPASVAQQAGGIFASASNIHFSPVMPFNTGRQMVVLANEANTSVTAYPVFTGAQLTCYRDINTQVGEYYSDDAFDLRTAYANPDGYPPVTLQDNVTATQATQSEDPGDWKVVQTQLKTETTQLSVLYQFQQNALALATALATAYGQSFTTATGIVSQNANCVMDILAAFSFVSIPFGEEEALELGAAIGIAMSVVQAGVNATSIDGPFSQLDFSTMINASMDKALSIYAAIQPDWGKVMRANQILQNGGVVGSLPEGTLQQAGDAYEISLYMTYCNSNMAIVSANGFDWGSCGNSDVALADIPSGEGLNGCNGKLCDRLTTLGVSQQSILDRRGGWSGMSAWECMKLQSNWTCTQVS